MMLRQMLQGMFERQKHSQVYFYIEIAHKVLMKVKNLNSSI